MKLRALTRNLFVLVILAAAVWPRSAQAQTKLYFKDGSYQLVKSYQIEGDRVRYYSVERSQWEMVPLSMVDFTTTQRVEAETRQRREQILREAGRTAQNTYQLPANTGILIAPGVRLPQPDGVYAYGGTRFITLIHSQASIARDRKRAALNMALPGPILKSRSFVILPGPAAGVRLINRNPTFYVKLAGGASVQLLRAKARKDDRVVEGLEARFSSKPVESRKQIPIERSEVAPGVYRLKPLNPLPPGEYALGEVEQGKLNLDVWDFGIDGAKRKVR
ncbi:MAG: hypothetical protein ACRD11_00035 [Terriglobia bacterium]